MTTFRVVGVRPGEGYIDYQMSVTNHDLGESGGGGDHTDANGGHGNGNGGGNGGGQPSRSLCAQCGVYPGTRAYGLCWRCYYTPGVRRAHQILTRGKRGSYPREDQVGVVAPTLLPSTPTEALPGTREKVDEMARRARQGLSLWHPLDAAPDQG
jgi:hypothetical protein